eukprot:616696_1
MGSKVSGNDLDNWKPKSMRPHPYASRRRKSQPTHEYTVISDKITKHTLHLTREPSKQSRLNYMYALCAILSDNSDHIQHRGNGTKPNNNKQKIQSLSIWNWRFLGSNDKYISRLAQALQNNSHIHTLHLVNCHIDCQLKIRILIEALKRRSLPLRDIDLSGNNFGNDDHAIKVLALFLSTYQCAQTLQNITLRATKLQDEQFANMIQILSASHTLLNSLKLLSVTHNKLKSHSIACLTKWLISTQKHAQIHTNTEELIAYLSTFHQGKHLLSLSLTTNPIRDSGAKQLMPLLESDVCISELHLRNCSLTTRGIRCLLDSYLVRQQRVIEQYTTLVYRLLKHIPYDLCLIIIECIADWTLDDRLKIHFGLSRCSLLVGDGFNALLNDIMNQKLIVKCLDIRMRDPQHTNINIVHVYRLVHYLKYIGNGNLGRLMFCVPIKMYSILLKMMRLLATNVTERDVDMVINNIIYKQTRYSHCVSQTVGDGMDVGDDAKGDETEMRHNMHTMAHLLLAQHNELMNNIYCIEEDEEAVVDMAVLEQLYSAHLELKQDRYNNDDITYQLNTQCDYGEFDLTHTSYIDVFGDQPLGLC